MPDEQAVVCDLPAGVGTPASRDEPLTGEMNTLSAEAWLDYATRFADRLLRLRQHVHADWHHRLRIDSLPSTMALSPPLAAATYTHLCGAVPRPQAFTSIAGRWCLLDQSEVHRRLAALALALRPGVIRCCLRRESRMALAKALGPSIEPLTRMAGSSPSVPVDLAEQAPEYWASVGYIDLVRIRAWPCASLRRWVRLTLPCKTLAWSATSRSIPRDELLRLVDSWLPAAAQRG